MDLKNGKKELNLKIEWNSFYLINIQELFKMFYMLYKKMHNNNRKRNI